MKDDSLVTYLNALARDESYRIADTLKQSPHETTEIVFFSGSTGGELGPFIRKRIKVEAGIGSVYSTLFAAQKSGKRFRYIPHIYDVHERDDELIVIMEYVSGRTLHDEVYERDASINLALELFPALCDGVTELHEEFAVPIIHRDLKPSNVMVNQGGITIIDFGIARNYREDASTDTMHLGTRAFAPPEQFGYGQTDERSDIYALGMILYYLLTEANPDSSTVTQRFVSQGVVSANLSPQLRQVILRATAFDPEDRYQSVRELKQAFLEAVAPRPETRVDESQQAHISIQRQSDPIKYQISTSEIVGLIWDGVVALVWLFLIIVCWCMPFDAKNPSPGAPMWFLILMYPVGMGLFFTGIAYGIMDKRVIRRRISWMKSQTFLHGLVVATIVVLVSLILLFALIGVEHATGNFGTV